MVVMSIPALLVFLYAFGVVAFWPYVLFGTIFIIGSLYFGIEILRYSIKEKLYRRRRQEEAQRLREQEERQRAEQALYGIYGKRDVLPCTGSPQFCATVERFMQE